MDKVICVYLRRLMKYHLFIVAARTVGAKLTALRKQGKRLLYAITNGTGKEKKMDMLELSAVQKDALKSEFAEIVATWLAKWE